MNTKKHIKTKIGVGSVVKAKFGELEKLTSEGRIRMMRKEVVVCVQAMVCNKKFLVQFKDSHISNVIASLLLYVCSKQDIGQ